MAAGITMTTTTGYGRLLGLPEVAERLSISLATARKWASRRRLPIVKIGGRVLVAERDLDQHGFSQRGIPAGLTVRMSGIGRCSMAPGAGMVQ